VHLHSENSSVIPHVSRHISPMPTKEEKEKEEEEKWPFMSLQRECKAAALTRVATTSHERCCCARRGGLTGDPPHSRPYRVSVCV